MKAHRRLNEPMQSRAEPITMRMLNGENDGQVLRRLISICGWNLEHWYDHVNWSELYPNWVVAEIDGTVVGGMQVTAGKPVGFLEMMCVEPGLGDRTRARIVRALVEYGIQVLQVQGSIVAMGTIAQEMKSFKKAVKRRGFKVVATGNMLGAYIGDPMRVIH